MNKTKRKIFEASMKLFAEKGYDATSIEEITATVGVAKGTLYYHFSSKEEIFNFLVEEGIKLLQNSIDIKTSKLPNYIDKLKAIILIQIKIVVKYEDIITILLTQFLGKKARNQKCQKLVYEYINKIEEIVKEGIKKGQIKQGNSQAIASDADVFITGEIKYHDYFGYDEHILLAEVGHYETEQYTKDIFCDIITKKFPNFAVHYTKVETNPINYL